MLKISQFHFQAESVSCTAGDCDDSRDFSEFIMSSLATTASSVILEEIYQVNLTNPQNILTTTVSTQTEFTTPESYDYENGWTEWGPWRTS